jgi:putative acetyltransferase
MTDDAPIPDTIMIREAVPGDANSTLTVLRGVLAEPDNYMTTTAEEFTTTEDEERAFIEQTDQHDTWIMLVAEDLMHGEIVGFLTCRGEARIARQHVVRLGIAVSKNWRGQGVGRQLMEAAIRWAGRHPRIRRIELDVAVENEGAVALYKSLGFEIEGRAVQALYKHGRYMDRYDMALLVDRVRRSDTG